MGKEKLLGSIGCAVVALGLIIFGVFGYLGAADRSEIAVGQCGVTGTSVSYGCLSCCNGYGRRRAEDAGESSVRLKRTAKRYRSRRSYSSYDDDDSCTPDYGYTLTVQGFAQVGCPSGLVWARGQA
jgi:hypothetical protein